MKIIIFHYHLNPGGVTRIIESQVEALNTLYKDLTIKVVTGGCDNPAFFKQYNTEVSIHPELNYLSREDNNHVENFTRIDGILRKLCNKNDILHFHNLNLGKNPLVTLAVSRMAKEGYNVVNHAHDFSEDRPDNQDFLNKIINEAFEEDLTSVMYPQYKNYTFAVLNKFDYNRLISYGVEESRCSLLANPVIFSSSLSGHSTDKWRNEICNELGLDAKKRIVTYPVRVIRRKNIGEFVLLASLFASSANWVVTQPPKNPVEIEHYEKWKDFCSKNKIRIFWEAGTKVNFEKLIRASDFCITTSIREGFGMVFMEPWLLGTPVIGRDIPMVTNDLTASGIDFPRLYNKLAFPDEKELHELSLNEQFDRIEAINNTPELAEKIIHLNPFLKDLLKEMNELLLKKNIEVILSEYSLVNYGKKLNGIYKKITG